MTEIDGVLIDFKNVDEWKGELLVAIEDRNLEGVEVGVKLADLDSSVQVAFLNEKGLLGSVI